MGWLIRFIHNRDMAVENIVKAYVRRCFMLSVPTETLEELRRAVDNGGVRLGTGSLLNSNTRVAQFPSAPGEYAVDVHMDCRTNKRLDLTTPGLHTGYLPDELRRLLPAMTRKHALGVPKLDNVIQLGTAVHLNGRPYKNGDFFEYIRGVPRRQWARAMDDAYKGVGRILALFVLNTSTSPDGFVVACFCPVSVRSREGNLTLLDDPFGFRVDGLECLHVDSITYKLRVVPGESGQFFALRMWEAR